MDGDRLEYSRHVRRRMRTYGISENEVEAIVWYPIRRTVTRWAVEHYGYADDGRTLKIVTNRAETRVITVTEEEPRPRMRHRQR